jgi:hypothetical protein
MDVWGWQAEGGLPWSSAPVNADGGYPGTGIAPLTDEAGRMLSDATNIGE